MSLDDTLRPPLKLLEGPQTFTLFADQPTANLRAVVLHGTYAEHFHTLKRLNDERPYGVYFTVNETNGRARKAGDIVRIRSFFIDIDGIPGAADKAKHMRALESAVLKPSAIVLSANGLHAYWYAKEGESTDAREFSYTNEHLIHAFGGDSSVKDLARVLRVPGFNHRKTDTPFAITTATHNPDRVYTAEAIRAAYPLPHAEATRASRSMEHRAPAIGDEERNQRIWRFVLKYIALWTPVDGKKHVALLTSFGVARKYHISQAQAEVDLGAIVSRWSIRSTVEHAIRNTSDWAYGPHAQPMPISALRTIGIPIPEYQERRRTTTRRKRITGGTYA